MSIDFALAKELKDAGFPKDGFEYFEGIPRVVIVPGVAVPGTPRHWRNVPTLEELIAACGSSFYRLHQFAGMSWMADDDSGHHEALGSNPKEAVARLWLALNKPLAQTDTTLNISKHTQTPGTFHSQDD